MYSESQLYLRKERNVKQERSGEQQRAILPANQTNANFVLNLEACVYFSSKLGAGDLGAQQ